MTTTRTRLAVAACALSGCYSLDYGPAPFACPPSKSCPRGYTCIDGVCRQGRVSPDATPIDRGQLDLPREPDLSLDSADAVDGGDAGGSDQQGPDLGVLPKCPDPIVLSAAAGTQNMPVEIGTTCGTGLSAPAVPFVLPAVPPSTEIASASISMVVRDADHQEAEYSLNSNPPIKAPPATPGTCAGQSCTNACPVSCNRDEDCICDYEESYGPGPFPVAQLLPSPSVNLMEFTYTADTHCIEFIEIHIELIYEESACAR